jgi:anti-sigma factor RsiW
VAESELERDDLLFAYAAGALDPAGRARVEAMLAADPRLRQRLAWYAAVCDGVTDALPPLANLPAADEIVARIRGGARKPGFFAWLAGPALRPVAAFAALLIVVQGAIIGMLAGERAEMQAVRSVALPAKTVVLVVAFDPDTPESEIRALLLKAGATIVDGPRQLGDYRIAVPANRAEFARQLFDESGIVEYVRVQEP